MGLPELFINGVSAAGAVAAAIVALIIATRDRGERRRERRAAERAQARLVLVEVVTHLSDIRYHIRVLNHSAQPILSVGLDHVVLQGHDARWQLAQDEEAVIRVVRPEKQAAPASFVGEFLLPDGTAITTAAPDEYGNTYYDDKPHPGLVRAFITFTDSSGNTWRADTDGHLTHTGTAD